MGLVLATYNVLDLFDPENDEQRAHLGKRIELIAGRLAPHAPDVVALQEIGSEAVLDDLARALGGGFHPPVVAPSDKRGIRNAILSRRPIVSSGVLSATHLPFPRFFEADPEPFDARIPLRRPIPEAVIDAGGDIGRVRVMSLHFKSRRAVPIRAASGEPKEPSTPLALAEAEVRALVWRCAEALFVRRVVDDRLVQDAADKIAVCGDFNDVPESLPVRVVAQSDLFSCALHVPELGRVSVLHGGDLAAIDHALLSPGLAKHFRSCSYVNEGLVDPDTLAPGEVVASDHAPLVVHFA
jgi:endonuclease/exonuclease/phosphatase family metal-dependent hydrolase